MGNFDIFTKPLTDFIISAHKKGPETFRLLSREQFQQIVKVNAFTSTGPLLNPSIVQKPSSDTEITPSKEHILTGDNLFASASFLNHSCEPNAHRSFYRDDSSVVFIKAIKDINELDEVTISYCDLTMTVSEREAATAQWGFKCACPRCQYERNLEYYGAFDPYKRFVELTSVDELLRQQQTSNNDKSTSQETIAAMFHCNYFAFEAKLEQIMQAHPLPQQKAFNSYVA